jgi:hypothetical protein
MNIPERLGWRKSGSNYVVQGPARDYQVTGRSVMVTLSSAELRQLDEVPVERIPAIIAGGKVFHDNPYMYFHWDHPIRLPEMLRLVIRPYLAQRMVD